MKPKSGNIKGLQIVQNRALRIVLKVDYRFSRQGIYQKLKIDCLSAKAKKNLVILIFKILNNLLPDFLSSQLTLKVSHYSLRNSACIIQLPKPNTNICKNSSIYLGAQLFNNLPENVRKENRLPQFIKEIGTIYQLEF